jgi:hypothetical protein
MRHAPWNASLDDTSKDPGNTAAERAPSSAKPTTQKNKALKKSEPYLYNFDNM